MNIKILFESKRRLALNLASAVSFSILVMTNALIFSDWEKFESEFDSYTIAVIWAIVFNLFSIALPIAVIWMSGRYILKIRLIGENEILISTWTIFGFHKKYKEHKSILKDADFVAGKGFYGRGPVVNAPWNKIKTSKGKTLVQDLQGTFYD
jgi:hypothetical protein